MHLKIYKGNNYSVQYINRLFFVKQFWNDFIKKLLNTPKFLLMRKFLHVIYTLLIWIELRE